MVASQKLQFLIFSCTLLTDFRWKVPLAFLELASSYIVTTLNETS